MSKERQRAREARTEARRREVEAAAAARARRQRREELRARVAVPRRTRRFGMLSTRALVQVAVLYVAVQAALWLVVDDPRTRLGLAVLSLAFTLVLVRTRKRSPR